MRRLLRWLWEYHGATKLDGLIHRFPGVRPRNVTATEQERDAILAAAKPHLRLWILLCSDLAIRSGTAARLAPKHYDAQRGILTFITKCDEHLTLPITDEIRQLFQSCNLDQDVSFVRQLWRRDAPRQGGQPKPKGDSSPLSMQFARLRRSVGITRKLTPHDLRRTTAVALYEYTHDIREVQALLGHRNMQSTVWYLDHALRPVKRSTLELIKRPAWRKEQTA